MLGVAPSKTQAFRCFQRVHAPRMTRELKPFLCCLGIFLHDFFHHSAKEAHLRFGTSAVKFSGCRMLNQNCLAKTHEVNAEPFHHPGHRGGNALDVEVLSFVDGQLSSNNCGQQAK